MKIIPNALTDIMKTVGEELAEEDVIVEIENQLMGMINPGIVISMYRQFKRRNL